MAKAKAKAKAKAEDANALPPHGQSSNQLSRQAPQTAKADEKEPFLALVHNSDYIPPVSVLSGFSILNRRRLRSHTCPAS